MDKDKDGETIITVIIPNILTTIPNLKDSLGGTINHERPYKPHGGYNTFRPYIQHEEPLPNYELPFNIDHPKNFPHQKLGDHQHPQKVILRKEGLSTPTKRKRGTKCGKRHYENKGNINGIFNLRSERTV